MKWANAGHRRRPDRVRGAVLVEAAPMQFGAGADGGSRRPPGRRRQRGAILVEFGLIALLLFTLLFGVIEFGWAFYQHLDVRHGAREGARLAAVNYQGSRPALLAETCNRMELDNASVRFTAIDP